MDTILSVFVSPAFHQLHLHVTIMMSVPPLIYIILTPRLKQTNIQLWTGTISLPLCPHFVKNLIRPDSLSFL